MLINKRTIEDWLDYFPALPDELKETLMVIGIILIGLLLGLFLKLLIFALVKIYRRKSTPLLTQSISKHLDAPASYFLPILVLSFMLPLVPLAPKPFEVLRRIIETGLIVTFAWGLIKGVSVVQDMVRNHFQLTKEDNIRERKLYTQLQFIKRIAIVLIVFFAVSLILMSFATVRKIGTGLLTSAGIASVIIGLAAQRSIANLLAGLQIAFSQPIRIDDVLVVEGEWGRVEEITFTYVVLRIWDDRRLILPLNYFIEKPFQSWTRSNSQLLGTVFIYADYTIPVDAVREELKRILNDHPLWDKRVCVLHVTDSKERTVELRALVSASNSGAAFDLRCDVREKLVTFIQQNYPDCLPKTRSVVEPMADEKNVRLVPEA